MALIFGAVESRPIAALVPADRDQLFSDTPWLAVTHRKPRTYDEAIEIQDQIAQELRFGQRTLVPEDPFTVSTDWHSDGFYTTPIANGLTVYGHGKGRLYMATTNIGISKTYRVPKDEQAIIDQIPLLQTAGKIGELVVRTPIEAGVSVFWTEIAPNDETLDVAHAVFAGPDRTAAGTEYMLQQ